MWRNITVSCRIPKNESNELVALCTSARPLTFSACSLLQGNQKPETILNPQDHLGTRRHIECIYFCSICSGTKRHIVHKTISIKAAKRSIVFRHFNQRFITFYNNIINNGSFLKNQVDSPTSGSKRCLTVRGLHYSFF